MINLTCSVSWEQSQEVNPELLIPSPRPSLLHRVCLLSLQGTFVGPEMVPARRGAVASDRERQESSQPVKGPVVV